MVLEEIQETNVRVVTIIVVRMLIHRIAKKLQVCTATKRDQHARTTNYSLDLLMMDELLIIMISYNSTPSELQCVEYVQRRNGTVYHIGTGMLQ